jgi:hypothetical protein
VRTTSILVSVCAVVWLAACGSKEASEAGRPQVVVDPPGAEVPKGYVTRRTVWALERVSSDGSSIWLWTAEGGCASFHHSEVREVEAGLRVDVFHLVPRRKNPICTMEVSLARHRVELPRPLGQDELVGECVPREAKRLYNGALCGQLHDEIAAPRKVH